tara:strand:- start:1632 stop:1802 length:171 start_codon:yes stop_codon:yes gene_type:complete
MSDYCIMDITFIKYDDEGNEVCNKEGNPILYTFKDHVDLSSICDCISDDEVKEVEK